MGIADKIKEGLKTNIRNNLDKENIKKILNVISAGPVLSACGATFASKSDKYLNIYSIKSLQRAYSRKYPVAYGSLFLPYELFHALGISPFLPEVIGGFTGGMGLADRTLKEAASRWYTPDLCTFHRSASGAVEMGLFPEPDFIICANVACDAAQKTFYIDAKKFGIEDKYYLIDVPYKNSPKAVSLLAMQLESISSDIAAKLGKKLDPDYFAAIINCSNEFRDWAIKVNDLRKELLFYPKNFNGLNFILPFHGLAGTKEAANLYKNIYLELKEFLEVQNGIISGNKKYKAGNVYKGKTIPSAQKLKDTRKILWMHLKPYYKNNLFTMLEENNYTVVFEEISNVYWPRLDPEKPFEALAIKMLSNPLNGSIENRVNAILKIAAEYGIDGAILFAHWGCRHSNGGARILKDSLKNIDIPLLILDGDCLNKNNSSEGQLSTRLQGFIEIVDCRV